MSFNPFNKKLSTGPKRQRIDDGGSVQGKLYKLGDNIAEDPFDDCFTGEELREIELVTTQVENQQVKKQDPRHKTVLLR